MEAKDFYDRHYRMTVTHGVDSVIVRKDQGSDWSKIELEIHGKASGKIQLRSLEMVEQLHFMLGQLLKRN